MIEIFTDGSCWPNPGPGGWAWAAVRDDKLLREGSGSQEPTTNNRMEMVAIIKAMEAFYYTPPLDKDIWIVTDSMLCMNTLTRWAMIWESCGWEKKSRGEIKNLDLVKQGYALYKKLPHLKFRHVRGHQGNKWNEYVDVKCGKRREEQAAF